MGAQVVFCHGCPGSPRDAVLACPAEWRVSAPDLLTTRDPVEAGIRAVADGADVTGERVTLVGFSIGAMVAIKVARQLPNAIDAVVLLSPAAPLQLGDYLDRMSGRPVFELARKRPGALHALAFAQRLALRVAPDTVLRQMFREVGTTERQLLADAAFRKHLVDSLNSSFGAGRASYVHLLRSYVADWRQDLDALSAPVEIWHGEEDRWAPVEIALDLAARIGPDASVKTLPGLGHYSTLTAFHRSHAGCEAFNIVCSAQGNYTKRYVTAPLYAAGVAKGML